MLALSAVLERGSAPLPFKIRQDGMTLSQGHAGLVTTNGTQGKPILILSSTTVLLRGKQAGNRETTHMPRRSTELERSPRHHRTLIAKKKGWRT